VGVGEHYKITPGNPEYIKNPCPPAALLTISIPRRA